MESKATKGTSGIQRLRTLKCKKSGGISPTRLNKKKDFTMEKITYSQVGDYLLPDLKLPDEETKITLGRYGMLHRDYLKKHKKAEFSYLLLTGTIMRHCKEIEDAAIQRKETIIEHMKKVQGVTEQLKAEDQMKWVGLMNNIRSCAEEIILKELIHHE